MKRISIIIAFLLLTTTGIKVWAEGNKEISKTTILGHWNYHGNSVNPVEVISDGEDVELFINGISFGHGERENDSLFLFKNVIFEPGDLTAVSYDKEGVEMSRHTLQTAGTPAQLVVNVIADKNVSQPDSKDIEVIEFAVTDFQGKICGNDSHAVILEIDGPAEWTGDLMKVKDNRKKIELNTVMGVNRAKLKRLSDAETIKVTAKAKGLAPTTALIQ